MRPIHTVLATFILATFTILPSIAETKYPGWAPLPEDLAPTFEEIKRSQEDASFRLSAKRTKERAYWLLIFTVRQIVGEINHGANAAWGMYQDPIQNLEGNEFNPLRSDTRCNLIIKHSLLLAKNEFHRLKTSAPKKEAQIRAQDKSLSKIRAAIPGCRNFVVKKIQ